MGCLPLLLLLLIRGESAYFPLFQKGFSLRRQAWPLFSTENHLAQDCCRNRRRRVFIAFAVSNWKSFLGPFQNWMSGFVSYMFMYGLSADSSVSCYSLKLRHLLCCVQMKTASARLVPLPETSLRKVFSSGSNACSSYSLYMRCQLCIFSKLWWIHGDVVPHPSSRHLLLIRRRCNFNDLDFVTEIYRTGFVGFKLMYRDALQHVITLFCFKVFRLLNGTAVQCVLPLQQHRKKKRDTHEIPFLP